jgi:hypothetical protein
MRKLTFIGVCGAALAVAAIPAQADVRSYCEAYARNQADTRLTGSAILGAAAAPSPEERKTRNTLALADCMALYTPKSEADTETVMAKPELVTARKPVLELLAGTSPAQQELSAAEMAALVPGGAAWNDYCAAKYTSFNRETGTYTARSGNQRPCRVTKS